MQGYDILIDKHVGEIAFVVGAGTSLHDLDLGPIHDHVVVSVNSSFILMPWQNGDTDKRYWISNDSAVRGWSYWSNVKNSHATKIVRDSWEKYYDEIPDFLIFSPRTTGNGIIMPYEKALAYSSSVPSAIDLSIQMGCKKIFLLGVDHYFSGKRSHFWQYYPPQFQPLPIRTIVPPFFMQQHIFDENKKSYDALKRFADSKGAEVYNCNPLSKVRPFKKIEYKEAINMIEYLV